MNNTCNQRELAHRLGINRSTLSSWLLRYGDDFPVSERGTNGRDWVFNFTEVSNFLRAKREAQDAAAAEREAAIARLRFSFADLVDGPGAPGYRPDPGCLSSADV
jgi:hypothetical protein